MAKRMHPYRSPRRQRQAQETREQILSAAREQFTSRGYGGASMGSIARAAGVAVQTLYATYGSKRAILFALLDQMAVDADPGRLQTEGVGPIDEDASQQLRSQIAFTTRFYARGGDLIDLARTVSGVEPDLGEMWREGETRRHRRQRSVVNRWKRDGALAEGLTVARATDVMWALTGPDLYRRLVTERGWTSIAFESWLSAVLAATLFEPSRLRGHRPVKAAS